MCDPTLGERILESLSIQSFLNSNHSQKTGLVQLGGNTHSRPSPSPHNVRLNFLFTSNYIRKPREKLDVYCSRGASLNKDDSDDNVLETWKIRPCFSLLGLN